MKKITALVIGILMISALLASCAAGKSTYPAAADNTSYNSTSEWVVEDSYDMGSQASQPAPDSSGSGLTGSNIDANLSAEKIIYSYSASVETTAFDETLGKLDGLLAQYGAFVETSYVSGSQYGYSNFRRANYTIRVPVSHFSSLTGGLGVLGNVYNENTTSQNITAQFTDTESRLKTYRTEESRLLSMLEKADTVEDMIAIEARLSEVRYQIESLTSTLRNWQNQVDYSTVTLHIIEVEELKDQLPAQRSYWEKIGDGFSATLKSIGKFFETLFMVIIIASPVLILLAAIAVIVIIAVRISRKKRKNPPAPPMQ